MSTGQLFNVAQKGRHKNSDKGFTVRHKNQIIDLMAIEVLETNQLKLVVLIILQLFLLVYLHLR